MRRAHEPLALLDVLLLLCLHQPMSDTVYALSLNSLVPCMCESSSQRAPLARAACVPCCHWWRCDFEAAAPPWGAWLALYRRPLLRVAAARVDLRRLASAGLRPYCGLTVRAIYLNDVRYRGRASDKPVLPERCRRRCFCG